ncbi:MAG: HlyC/CorC family transporter [Verrucomicrobia bacterium]|nr:HlyC/CorC family transporter [Verrucomicrobiota bacterium]
MMLLLGLLLIVGFLATQAFFSSTEMAIVSCSRLRLRHHAEHGDRRAATILGLLSRPERFLGTTLVGVNLSVIIMSTVANVVAYRLLPEGSKHLVDITAAVPLTILIVIFGEIVPMTLARHHSWRMSWRQVDLLTVAMRYVLRPVVEFASSVSKAVAALAGGAHQERNPFVSREELRLLLKEGAQTGLLDPEGRRMIHRIFELHATFAKDIMTPLIDVVAVPADATAQQVVALMRESGHSRVPVYEQRVDEIVGVVSAFDFLHLERPPADARAVMRRPRVVPESKPIDDLLLEFQLTNSNFALVVDEYGGVSGIITSEDIIEEIVGEISDEYDRPEPPAQELVDGMGLIDGRLRIEEFNEEFEQKLPEAPAETVGGLVVAYLGRIPRAGETIEIAGLTVNVLEATERRVERLSIKPLTSRHDGPISEGNVH